jgi:hypothetical protein
MRTARQVHRSWLGGWALGASITVGRIEQLGSTDARRRLPAADLT